MNKSNLSFVYRIIVLLYAFTCMPIAAKAAAIDDFFNAAAMNSADEVMHLLRQGIDPNTKEKHHGNTGLIVALQEGAMAVFQVLVNAPGIDLEAKANNGNNALMVAAYKGNMAAIDILLKKGAAINRPNWTPLHYAAAGGHNRIVQLFLDRGANINARSPNLTTPLMIAAYEGFDSTVQLLLERGADVTLKNETGLNAADYAKRLDRRDIIDLINNRLAKAKPQAAEPEYPEYSILAGK